MLPIHIHSPFPQNPPFCIPNPPATATTTLSISQFLHHDEAKGRTICSSFPCVVRAMDKDSQQDFNPEMAKEALQQLDQQFQTLSKKQVSPPRIKASEVKLTRDDFMEEEEAEISGPFLISLTTGIIIFTVFYNILFYTVIKPGIDGPDDVTITPIVNSESQLNLQ